MATARGPNPPKVFEVSLGDVLSSSSADPSRTQSMPIYVRIGMQALYHGKEQAKILATKRVSDMLKEQSVKQGKVFDSPDHALEQIQRFIKTYKIDCSELLHPNMRVCGRHLEFGDADFSI